MIDVLFRVKRVFIRHWEYLHEAESILSVTGNVFTRKRLCLLSNTWQISINATNIQQTAGDDFTHSPAVKTSVLKNLLALVVG